jgi:outer membrane biosynthesis protein TonB
MMVLHKRLLAVALGIALVAALLVLSSLKVVREPAAKKTIVLQNVQIFVQPTPPPVPEPVKRSSRSGAASALKVQIPQQAVQLGLMQLDTSFTSMRGIPVGAGLAGAGTGLGGEGFGSGDLILQLNELDSIPMVMSAPLFVFPEKLKRKNISSFVAQFQIFVDEEGHTFPVRVVESPDPALDEQLMDYAAHVMFTPPVRAGKKVKAQYLWPVRFTDDKASPDRRRNVFR